MVVGFNWSMVLLENVNVNSKLELHQKEREYLEKLGATLNFRLYRQELTKKNIWKIIN